jgi:acetyl-CoA synthetase
MPQENVYPVSPEAEKRALMSEEQYQQLYEASIKDPENFWIEQADKYITWTKRWEKVVTGTLKEGNVRWFVGGQLNACYNCLDRHLPQRANKVALIWESDDPKISKHIIYAELYEQVCRFANVLKSLGVQKGDRICIYLPMIPEAAVAMLACARIGAIHSVVFGGFSAHALQERILDADCKIVITADESIRGGKNFSLKVNVDQALLATPNVKNVIVVQRTGHKVPWQANRDLWYHETMEKVSTNCPIVDMDANDPLFILYTSGSTGIPKGVLQSTGGYLLFVAMTHQLIFSYHENDIYWCTADVGWVTGHSYIIYGPLANGATTCIYEGIPTYPSPARFWQIVDKHQVSVFYTAPTALRTLMAEGDKPVQSCSRKSLQVLGTVGEPINPEAWEWYYNVVGDKRCSIVDTWWQTETGGILISPIAGVTPLKPGSATKPFFGIVPGIIDDTNQLLTGEASGRLVISQPWPGQLLTIYGNQERFMNGYLRPCPGSYLTGDGAKRDADGYYWITGRIDDVIKISGHRLGTAEIESALATNTAVAEAGVVGCPDKIKGQSIYAFVVLKKGFNPSDQLRTELMNTVREQISPIAKPDVIQFAIGLPKTRSGKIMRRILRSIVENDSANIGDTSTLADPSVVQTLLQQHQELINKST